MVTFTEENLHGKIHFLCSVTWTVETWTQLDKEFIIRPFKPCALTLKNDGSAGNIIHCFKSGQPNSEGTSLLKDQVNILTSDDIVDCNPFEVTDSDVDESNTETNFIDESNDEDDLIDIKQRCNIYLLLTQDNFILIFLK